MDTLNRIMEMFSLFFGLRILYYRQKKRNLVTNVLNIQGSVHIITVCYQL